MTVLTPPIKCQGIKTKLVPTIFQCVDWNHTGCWIEPFVGSSIVPLNIHPSRALLADLNPHLIRLYRAIQTGAITGRVARLFLEKEGCLLTRKGEDHYYVVRERFNAIGDPLDFLFLNRACFNGLIRFNKRGQFNVPFCRKPQRFAAAYITKIVNQIERFAWVMRHCSWTFVCQDYRDTIALARVNDFVYCDPPYIGRHTNYFDQWDDQLEVALHESLMHYQGRFMVSTWHSNEYRKNPYLNTLWKDFTLTTHEHFYHVGAREKNRKPMLEALVTNYAIARGADSSHNEAVTLW